ncbi:hypothetical protein AAVH_29328 [Aphelenchoides avenae]|nr:hypothetical protein AAVH_29328 [Aphelenchus avenae]
MSTSTTSQRENIAAVMPLADSFGAKIILERCEQFLVDEMDLSKAIPTLEKFSLNELKKQLLETATKEDLDELTADDDAISQFSKETMSFVLKEYKRRLSLFM